MTNKCSGNYPPEFSIFQNGIPCFMFEIIARQIKTPNIDRISTEAYLF